MLLQPAVTYQALAIEVPSVLGLIGATSDLADCCSRSQSDGWSTD